MKKTCGLHKDYVPDIVFPITDEILKSYSKEAICEVLQRISTMDRVLHNTNTRMQDKVYFIRKLYEKLNERTNN